MGAMGINMAEKKLLRHLTLGGSCDDEVGHQLVYKLVTKIWSDPTIAPMLRQHGVTTEELALVYLSAIEALMPEPWMNVSGPMLVPTQWFMEPHRFESLLVETTREAADGTRDEWLQLLIETATYVAVATKEVHDEQYGKPNVNVVQIGGAQSARGCAVAFMLLGATFASAAVAIVHSILGAA